MEYNVEQVTALKLEALDLYEHNADPQKMGPVKDGLELCHTEGPNQFPHIALNGTCAYSWPGQQIPAALQLQDINVL